tara:strand:- start:899 stop:2785 length:1887 start_codon:yes stop_codon:yes gene_type:complete
MLDKEISFVRTMNTNTLSNESKYKIEPAIIAKAIIEGPQKKVLDKINMINRKWVTPNYLYPIRTQLNNLPKLGITEKFNWKRGYRDIILSVINNRLNQYDKSSASLQVLLNNRPGRLSHERHDFQESVISVDNMMRDLRKKKESFADNSALFEKVWKTYFAELNSNFDKFEKNLKHLNPKMKFKWYIQTPGKRNATCNTTSKYDDDYFHESFLCYELYWTNVDLPTITSEGNLLQNIPIGDLIFKWNIRLSALMCELIHQYYRESKRTKYRFDASFDEINFLSIINGMKYHQIERCQDLGSTLGSTPNYRDHDNNHDEYNKRESKKIGLFSKARMLNSVDSSNERTWNFGWSPDLLMHPFISMNRQNEHHSITSYISKHYTGNFFDGNYAIKLLEICWGDCHSDMWNQIVKLRFNELAFTLQNWNRYTIPGANPLNNIRMAHWGMPADFGAEYRSRISQNSSDCYKSQERSLNIVEQGSIKSMFDSEDTYYRDREHFREEHLSKTIEILSYCDSIKCTMRNENCSRYLRSARQLNEMIGTTEDEFPFGSDLSSILQQKVEEEIDPTTPSLSADPSLSAEEGYHFEETIDNLVTDSQNNVNEQEQADQDSLDEIAQQMRTWYTARGGRV